MERNPGTIIDYDELVFKSPQKLLLIIEGDSYWFERDEVELDEEEFTVEMSQELVRKKGFV